MDVDSGEDDLILLDGTVGHFDALKHLNSADNALAEEVPDLDHSLVVREVNTDRKMGIDKSHLVSESLEVIYTLDAHALQISTGDGGLTFVTPEIMLVICDATVREHALCFLPPFHILIASSDLLLRII